MLHESQSSFTADCDDRGTTYPPLGAGLRRLKALSAIYDDEAIQFDRMVPGIVTGVPTRLSATKQTDRAQ
jgi:hypothetical protein